MANNPPPALPDAQTAECAEPPAKLTQPKAKEQFKQIWHAESREHADKAFDTFVTMFEDKYPKATACIEKDREEMLTFFDFPAAHWQSIRTTNPIESSWASVPRRTGEGYAALISLRKSSKAIDSETA